MSRTYIRYLDEHWPYNPAKARVGLYKVERGWVGFWQFKGCQKHRWRAHNISKKFKDLPVSED